jgi:hypothetical protein
MQERQVFLFQFKGSSDLYDHLPQRREERKEEIENKNTKTFARFAPLRQKLINQRFPKSFSWRPFGSCPSVTCAATPIGCSSSTCGMDKSSLAQNRVARRRHKNFQ